jgi:chlorobactene glucosyltransferase
MTLILATAPWLLILAALPLLLRQRPDLTAYSRRGSPDPPMVSVIVPTHDDARRVGASLATLLDSDYPFYEIVVVDADSRDGTREIVAALESRAPDRVRLLDAGVAPVGRTWRGWACGQGHEAARGELLLFTRPGTYHDAGLLARAVAALEAEEADMVSVYPRLTMNGFWERLVMPHIWVVLTARLPTASAANRWQDPDDAVASKYFMLVRRDAYEAAGGHGSVAANDPEGPALAKALLGNGSRVFLVHGEAYLETRMYRSLARIADELAIRSAPWRGSLPEWSTLLTAWLVVLTPVLFFVVPPVVLVGGALGLIRTSATAWAFQTTAISLIFWLVVYTRHRIRPAYAVAFPVGALVSALAFARGILVRHDDMDLETS